MNAPALFGAMPENVSESDREMAIAGLAKNVEAVNQYAATEFNAMAQVFSTLDPVHVVSLCRYSTL